MKIDFNVIEGVFDLVGSTSGPAITTNSFETIQVPTGTSPVADSPTDVLTLANGPGISIVGDTTTDTVTISSTNLDLVTYSQYGGL